MKKRFAALFLALALCAGLAVPAFAAGEGETPRLEVTLDLPDGYTIATHAGEYRLQEFTVETVKEPHEHYVKTYDVYTRNEEPSVRTFVVTPLPLGTGITLGNLHPEQGGWLNLELKAWSDSDGDGVYEERIFEWGADGANATMSYRLKPSAEKGPFSDAEFFSSTSGYATTVDMQYEIGSRDSLSITSDSLYEYFGSDTLLQITSIYEFYQGDSFTTSEKSEVTRFLITGGSDFTDVPASEWYAAAVNWAVSKNITNGTGNGKFSPAQSCTHAQILTFLYRAAQNQGKAEPADMDKAVAWAREKGMIDGSFNGSKPCTRADAVNYIWQALGREDAKAGSFTDVDPNAGYARAVDWAVANGVTNGDNPEGTQFNPDKVCTRGHIVTFLHRAYVPEARLTVKS